MKKLSITSFLGAWSLERAINDISVGGEGRLSGTVDIRREGEGWAYNEKGALRYGDQPQLAATRRYLWQSLPGQRPGIEVLFEDGRPFHIIDLGQTMPHAEHVCAPDLYHVTYDFAQWPTWYSVWRVSGPRKNYRMLSRYRPQGATGLAPPSPLGQIGE
ncbi:MAG: DUF6314 family protein [Pseudomonadota bacterium]